MFVKQERSIYNTGAMKLFGKKNCYVLMHKDIPVLKADYSEVQHEFKDVMEILNETHLPIGCRKHGELSLHRLNYWYIRRSIPGYRVGLSQLMSRLEVSHPMDLVEYTHAVSVSDTYWLKKENENVEWKDVSFFSHSFDQAGFGSAMFASVANINPDRARVTPNSNTAGFHRKAWFERNDGLVLLKGGYPFHQMEPVNEWLAYTLGTQLHLNVLPYHTEVYENALVSVCPCMTDENTDLVTAEMILMDCDAPKDELQLSSYIAQLDRHGIKDARKKVSQQILLDYILMNTDRHAQNMGILVDANTNTWIDTTPIFDTGTCLGCLVEDNEILSEARQHECTLLNRRHFDFDLLLNHIDLDDYEFPKSLLEIPREYGNQLVRYQSVTGITDERIENAYTLLYRQLLKIRKLARNRN